MHGLQAYGNWFAFSYLEGEACLIFYRYPVADLTITKDYCYWREDLPNRRMAQCLSNNQCRSWSPTTPPERSPNIDNPPDHRVDLPITGIQEAQQLLSHRHHSPKLRLPRIPRRPPRPRKDRHILREQVHRPAHAYLRSPSRHLSRQ